MTDESGGTFPTISLTANGDLPARHYEQVLRKNVAGGRREVSATEMKGARPQISRTATLAFFT